MQELAMEPGEQGAHPHVRHSFVAPAAIDCVAHDRMLEPLQVHSDLVSPAGLNLDVEEGESVVMTTHAIDGERGASPRHNTHAGAVARVARDRLLDASRLLSDLTVHERDVGFENFTGAKLVREIFVRGLRLGDDDEAGSVFIEAMHD